MSQHAVAGSELEIALDYHTYRSQFGLAEDVMPRVSYNSALDALTTFMQRPGYRQYLRNKLRDQITDIGENLLRRTGYNQEMWVRIVYRREWQDFLAALPLKSLAALEISPGGLPVLNESSVAYYRAVSFPGFDVTQEALSEQFDIIIAEHVFEHLRHPYRAAHNVYKMLRDGGVFLFATPFLIKIHGHPQDYTRWTPDGVSGFLEDCGFTADVHCWGNRKAVKANFASWSHYGWRRDLRNEAEFPASVWAYARKQVQRVGAT